MTSSKLLINESPLQVLPTLATWIGLNEAIFLQQVHYWLSNPKMGTARDDRKWIRNSVKEWQEENFPFWDDQVIKRTIENLEQDQLLLSRDDLNKHNYDRTKWYTINYNLLNSLNGPIERIASKKEKRRMARAQRKASVQNVPLVQNVPMENNKMYQPPVQSVPDDTRDYTKTTQDSNDIGASANGANAPHSLDKTSPKWLVMNEFTQHSGIPYPTRKQDKKFWWSAVSEIFNLSGKDAEKGKRYTRKAIDELRAARLTISDPNSLVKTIRDMVGKENSACSNTSTQTDGYSVSTLADDPMVMAFAQQEAA